MQVRIGVCTSCDAKFEIPVSFDQAWAKCLICEAAVRIGEPEQSDAAKKAERAAARDAEAAEKKKALDAKKAAAAAAAATAAAAEPEPEPAPEPEPEPVAELEEEAELELEPLEEAELEAEPLEEEPPAEKPMSTLERLKAERAAAAAAAAAPAAKPQSTLERLKAERAAAAAVDSEPAAPAKKASSATSSRSRRSKSDGDGAGSGRSKGARRRPTAKKAERNQAPMMIGAGSLVVIGIGVIGISQGWFGGGNEAQAGSGDTEVADAPETTPEVPAVNPFDNVAGTTPSDPAAAGAAAVGSAIDGSDTADTEPATPAAPAEPAAAPPKDPDSVDLAALPDYEKLPETSDEDWAAIVADAEKMVDPAGTRGSTVASQRLIERGKEAFPAIMNAFKTVDLYDSAGLRTGGLVQRTLEEICNGVNYGWRDGLEPGDIYFNKKVVVAWNTAWGKAKDNEYAWASLSGQEQPTPADDESVDG